MSKVSSKRQITLPIDLCILAGIEPGDEVSVFVDRQGILSVVKKTSGSAKGFLRGKREVKAMSDESSLKSIIQS
ncbi:AbrB/MazE/SpoVT family DNA-binding domain-containing protein [Cellvibrio sp. pealriver]|uniref:AbrB/MazE/SpoVT family DNA-binding domain-containing protein n=1 Tax=Cellvibrio sp. pealriver TaxID=1622269 RepID=UPI00066FFE8F|nr:AbrB/MazE/SpoVT family DNA-binding domain-containing protein [Cellvibrio sp. pealriver]